MTPDQLSNLGFSIVGVFLIFLVILCLTENGAFSSGKKAFVG
jgi:hypothetical protein